jgi:hypothetical protein
MEAIAICDIRVTAITPAAHRLGINDALISDNGAGKGGEVKCKPERI